VLCHVPGVETTNCGQGTVQVGDQVFSYSLDDGNVQAPWFSAADFPATTCTKLVIEFTTNQGMNYETGDTANTAYARVIQTGPVSATASAPYGQLGTLTATLNGSPFQLQFRDLGREANVFADGYAMCSTDTGAPE
jgi:hypothetical protein